MFQVSSEKYLLLSGKPLHKTTKTSGSCGSAAVISMAAKRILQFGQLPHNIQLVQLPQILLLQLFLASCVIAPEHGQQGGGDPSPDRGGQFVPSAGHATTKRLQVRVEDF